MLRTLNEERFVVIYDWPSRFNKIYKGHGVGHIAIEVRQPEGNVYMSLWPNHRDKEVSIFNEVKPAIIQRHGCYFMDSYGQDIYYEGERTADTIIALYSLDTNSIINEFNQITKLSQRQFKLTGNHQIIARHCDCCASFALKLLKAGGLDELAVFGLTHKLKLFETPDDVSHLVIKAKEVEKDRYPETKDFNFTPENYYDYVDCKVFNKLEASRLCTLS